MPGKFLCVHLCVFSELQHGQGGADPDAGGLGLPSQPPQVHHMVIDPVIPIDARGIFREQGLQPLPPPVLTAEVPGLDHIVIRHDDVPVCPFRFQPDPQLLQKLVQAFSRQHVAHQQRPLLKPEPLMLQQGNHPSGGRILVKDMYLVAFLGGKSAEGQSTQTGADDGYFHGRCSFS